MSTEPGPQKTVLSIRGLRLSRGPREILRGVGLHAEQGELLALMGLSGGGKTTVLRTVAALERFDSGDVDVDGVLLRGGAPPDRDTLRRLRTKVGLVSQLHDLFGHLTALQNVTLAPMNVHGRTRAEAESRAHALLDAIGVGHRASALPRELSGGEAQ
ncbi:MAG: ATP-binding cassette domain-containing protein, partial [Thermoanaerobaculia bacterium]